MARSTGPPSPSETDRFPPMTHYVLGFFRRAPAAPAITDEETNRIQETHLAHLRQLLEGGDLIAAGPLEENVDLRGVLLFSTPSLERARELMKSDPALTNGRLILDLYSWYAPAGLRVAPPAPNPTELNFQTD
jgi:uncharacterized protein